MKKFEDWLYWHGTKWILILYILLAITIALWLPDWWIMPLMVSLIPYFEWLKKYEKNYKKGIDKAEEVDYNKDTKKK